MRGDENGTDDGSPWLPLIAVMVAIATFFIVVTSIGVGKGLFGMADVLQSVATRPDPSVVKTGALREAKQLRRSATVAGTAAIEDRVRQGVEANVEELRRAALVEFDAERRDELAREVLVGTAIESPPKLRVGTLLFEVGAFEVLVEETPPAARRDEWYRAAARIGAWDAIREADAPTAASAEAAKALCLAGAQKQALAMLATLIERQTSFALQRRIADALACGGPHQLAQTEFVRPSETVASLVAARDLEGLREQHRRLAESKRSRDEGARLDAAAVLFAKDAMKIEELIEAGSRARYFCWDPPDLTREGASPEVLIAAADAVAASSAGSAEERAAAVENLRTGASLAGLVRLRDTRPPGFEPTDERNLGCLAHVELAFNPAAAERRLKRLRNEMSRTYLPVTMLAVAYAHQGDFDAAFETATELQEMSRPKHGSRSDGNWMAIAFGHAAGRLDEVELLTPDERMTKVLDALRGTEEDRARVRREKHIDAWATPPGVGIYIRGALAPGHEEEFIRSYADQNIGLSTSFRNRAIAATWRGDDEAAAKWTARRKEFHERAEGGANGGLYLLYSRW